jgi:hypothetical protein
VTKARLVINQKVSLTDERFYAYIKVFQVSRSPKFPLGYKVSCALVEKRTGSLWILLDNHEPYGYHLHTKLPEDKDFRASVNVKGYKEAIELFFTEVEKKVQNEK